MMLCKHYMSQSWWCLFIIIINRSVIHPVICRLLFLNPVSKSSLRSTILNTLFPFYILWRSPKHKRLQSFTSVFVVFPTSVFLYIRTYTINFCSYCSVFQKGRSSFVCDLCFCFKILFHCILIHLTLKKSILLSSCGL